MSSDPAPRVFQAALDGLIEQVKTDQSVLAAILCGSLSHDTVWEKSDIDLVLVTVDEKLPESSGVCLYADGVNVHAMLMSRTEFRKVVEGSARSSFMHSFLAKGRLLYTHDPSIGALCAGLAGLGQRDLELQLLRAATNVLAPLYKAHKWMRTGRDLEYVALWILYAATPLAQMEVLAAGQLVDREVIPQAMRLNPTLFQAVYVDVLNGAGNRARVAGALKSADEYLLARASTAFAPILEHLREVGEIRSCRDIEHHFERHAGFSNATTACEYLADQGFLGKASAPARLTKRSRVEVQELAFFYIDPR